MTIININDIIFIMALLLSFITALAIAYLLLNEVEKLRFLLLIGTSSLLFSAHHLLELSLDIGLYNINEVLETGSVIFLLAAMLYFRRSERDR